VDSPILQYINHILQFSKSVFDLLNAGDEFYVTDLKLFTTYSPPNHAAGILQKTKAETKGYVPKGAIEQEG
jgi:hypothetical protein